MRIGWGFKLVPADCYLIRTADWVRDLYPHKAIRGVTADLQDESFPEGSGENNEDRERKRLERT